MKQQTWLDPDNLVNFIDELKDADYNIGVAQYIAAQDLVLTLITEGVNLDQPQRFKNMLGSLFCNSPQEQEDFSHRFDQWIERMGFAIATEDNTASEKARTLERELIKVRKQSKNWKKIWLFVSGIVSVSIIGVSIAYFSSLPSPPETPKNPNPNPTPPPSPIPPPTNTEWQILLIALLVILVTFLIWRWWWRRRANLFWKRNATTENPKLQEISIADNDKELFPNLLYLKIAQQFRQRIKVKSREINVEKTFTKTLENGGWYTPVYETRQIPPEYLFLVDRASYGDHQARFITEMIDRLSNNGVFITGYYFDDDPRICFPMTGQISSCKLTELAAKYSEYRLVVFSEAERLFSPVTGELESWVEIFGQWQESAVLTPKPVENWGYEELELAEQFMILPATADGLSDFINNLEIESSTFSLTSKDRPPIPDSLQERPLYWIDREPPEDYVIENVLPSLKQYLGQDGYLWLSACAIFPELHWNLTLYLGNALKTEAGKAIKDQADKTLLQTSNLSDLARLPWFRYGYMPDWLRILLIADLSPEQDKNIRAKLSQLLVNAVSGSVSGIQLEIAEKHRNSVSKITQPLLKLFADKSSTNSPLRDYIFQDFLAGKNEKLAVKLPNNLRQIITVKSKPGWKLWWQLIFSQALASTIGVMIITVLYYLEDKSIITDSNATFWIILVILTLIYIYFISQLQIYFLNHSIVKFDLSLKFFWIVSNILISPIAIIVTISLFTVILNFPDILDGFEFSYIPYILVIGIIVASSVELIKLGFLNRINKSNKIGCLILSRFLDITVTIIIFSAFDDIFSGISDIIVFSTLGLIVGIFSELFSATTLVWILRQPVSEKQKYRSRFSPVILIVNIILVVSTILGLFSYYLLQNEINDTKKNNPLNNELDAERSIRIDENR